MKTIFHAWFFRLIQAVLFLAIFCSVAHAQNGSLGQFLRNAQGGTIKAIMESGPGLTGRYTAIFPAQHGKVLLIDTTTGIANLTQTGTTPELRFYNSTGNFYSGFKAPVLTSSTTFTWPADAGSSGQVLASNGSGMLNWSTPNVSFWGLSGNNGTNVTSNFIGTTDANPLAFRANNAERMRIAAGGNIGVGTTNPAEKLDVAGNLRFSGALMPNGQPGTLGYVLFSMGANAAPIWVDGAGYLNTMSWQLTGNNVNAEKKFGTTNNYALPVITNNTERMRIAADGKVGIGTNNPLELFDVNGNALIGTAGQNGRLKISNINQTNTLDLYTDDDVTVRLTNSGFAQTGASLQLKSSAQDYLFSFEGRGGFRYFSRVSNAETFKVDDTGEMTSYGTGTNVLNGKLGVGGTLSDAYSFVELKKALAAGTESVLLTLNSSNGSAGAGSSLQYKNAGAGYLSAIAGIDDGNFNGRLEFRTNNTAGARTTPLIPSDNKMVLSSNGNLGIGTNTPAEKLDVAGNLRFSGVLMPGGSSGTAGQVLQSNGAGAAPTWVAASSSSAWNQGGNSLSTLQKFGTTSNFDIPFVTNNTERMRLTAAGNVSIGNNPAFTASPNTEKLLVDAGTTNSYNLISAKGSINNYLQMNLQNRSNGNAASTDIVATADNGTEANNYIDMGINSSNYSGGLFGGVNDAYLYNMGQDLLIGTGTAGRSLKFMTGGPSETSNTRMTIDGSGDVGIGTVSPAEKLDVAGNIRMTGTSAKKLIFGAMTGDIDASIGLRNTPVNEQQEMLFYVGNDNQAAYGPDRIRMVAEEFRLQTFDNAGNSSLANAESETGTNTRLFINAAGNVGIGTDAPNGKLTVAGNVTPLYNGGSNLGADGARWSQLYVNSINQTSDRRQKKNIAPLTYGLKQVMSLQPVSYNWKDTTHKEAKIGLIAQDVRKVVPEVVMGDEAKETIGMNYAELVPVLINAIKEQQGQIEDLKKEISNLKKNK